MSTTNSAPWKRRRRRGHAMMETAYLFLPFAMLVLGTIEFCRLMLIRNSIAFAASQGARYASVRGQKSASPVTSATVTTYVRSQCFGVGDPSAINVTTTWPDGDNKPGSRVKVVVSYNYQPAELLVLKNTIALGSASQLVIRQ
jgi:Flp pilus assembly protein TadG